MTGWAERPAYKTGQRVRCTRRFRQQIWSPKHPQRRIHRIYRCVACRKKDVQTEAHHVDYNKPYVVVWVCGPCHRRIDCCDLKVRKRWIYDYTSLVIQIKKLHRTGDTQLPHRIKTDTPEEEVPF